MRERTHVNLNDAAESLYWCVHLDVDHAALRRAVERVGSQAAAVERYLRNEEELRARPAPWRQSLYALFSRIRPPVSPDPVQRRIPPRAKAAA